ncbi:MAG: hypothetical protein RBS80_15370 [Thermoguttaceae bacterium]|jgi:hypothetical protein|nr:hypothetical protein [Thermoguttaceae bacterium]
MTTHSPDESRVLSEQTKRLSWPTTGAVVCLVTAALGYAVTFLAVVSYLIFALGSYDMWSLMVRALWTVSLVVLMLWMARCVVRGENLVAVAVIAGVFGLGPLAAGTVIAVAGVLPFPLWLAAGYVVPLSAACVLVCAQLWRKKGQT